MFVLGQRRPRACAQGTIFAKREFAGYWEYLLDEALFATPAHPEWSGAALVGDDGRLVGIGSLLVQEAVGDDVVKGNMFVPVDLLAPILEDLLRTGSRRRRRGHGSACTRRRRRTGSSSMGSHPTDPRTRQA